MGRLNLKDTGDQREASALRDEVCSHVFVLQYHLDMSFICAEYLLFPSKNVLSG